MTIVMALWTHFLTKRCLNGQNVAWSRSKEIAIRLIREVNENKCTNAKDKRWDQIVFRLYFHREQRLPIMCSICRGPDTTPTKRSTIARWMIKYVLRRCSWRFFFTKTTMVMILRMTMARHSTMRTTSHGIHSEAEDKRCIFSELS